MWDRLPILLAAVHESAGRLSDSAPQNAARLFDRLPRRRAVHIIRQSLHIVLDAFYRFDRDDGWAIASHIALSILMSVFPFLIVVTAITGFIGSVDLANEVARLLLEAWPDEVAGPLATEIHHVLTTSHGGLVTISAVFAVYFSSSGIESLRIGLNRAYGLRERRSFWVLRLESIGFVLLSAIALLVLAFLVVLGPLFFRLREARA
jgi:membrane protein